MDVFLEISVLGFVGGFGLGLIVRLVNYGLNFARSLVNISH